MLLFEFDNITSLESSELLPGKRLIDKSQSKSREEPSWAERLSVDSKQPPTGHQIITLPRDSLAGPISAPAGKLT